VRGTGRTIGEWAIPDSMALPACSACGELYFNPVTMREIERANVPVLTADEEALVVAAIPLQTGLTRDGERAIARAEAMKEAAESMLDRAKALAPGKRVRTAAMLKTAPLFPERRTNADGVITRAAIGNKARFWVRHDDGTEAPYDADELTPIGDPQ
jgi:hypothetical protein